MKYEMNQVNLLRYLRRIYHDRQWQDTTPYRVEATGAIYAVHHPGSRGELLAMFGQQAFQNILTEMENPLCQEAHLIR